jgi:hypothetical protein
MTENDLDLIFEYGNTNKHIELIKLLQNIWHWPDYIKYEDGKLELHTGGWSENERIITELAQTIFWAFFWQKSERGGHHYFTIWNGDKLKGNLEDDFDQMEIE